MPKITKQEIEKINSKCMNDWKLDIQYFLFHSQKTLVKIIELDKEHYLQFKIDYNYKNQIILFINKYYHKTGDSFSTSNGLGKTRILAEESASRKSINKLIQYAKELTDKELLTINSQTEVTRTPMFVASEIF